MNPQTGELSSLTGSSVAPDRQKPTRRGLKAGTRVSRPSVPKLAIQTSVETMDASAPVAIEIPVHGAGEQ